MYSADFDPDEWCLPPLDDEALPSEPPPFHGQPTAGVFLGSELGAVRFTHDAEFVDLGEAVVEGFAALTASERVDALIAVERQRAWLDGVPQQLLAEVVRRDDPKQYSREEASAALGLSLQTT
jgi:hypothetical protein